MDKISEFFKELKDRISNPLFFSFIVGWIVVNWKIVVGLLFYSITQLEKDGYTSYQNLIITESNICNSFLWPFVIALGYTFLFPIIRNWIHIFNAWNQKWGTEKTLAISKDGKVSVNRYIQLRELYEKRKLTIEEVLEKEASYLKENENLISLNRELNEKIREKEREEERRRYLNDINQFMEGEWLFRIGTSNEDRKVVINKGNVYLNDDYSRGEALYQIINLVHNPFNYETIILFRDINRSIILTEVFSSDFQSITFKNKSNKGAIMKMKKMD